jgi:hypothetical protein
MRIELWGGPLSSESTETPETWEISEPLLVTEILSLAELSDEDFEWFKKSCSVRFDGHVINPDYWHLIRTRPDRIQVIELCPIPQGNNVLAALAQVATVVAQAFFLATGNPLLAAGAGIVGQLLVSALSAPPQVANNGTLNQKALVQAGITSNVAELDSLLPVGFGRFRYSPPLLTRGHTVFTQEETREVVVVGFQGRYKIADIQINALPIDQVPGLLIESGEGSFGDAARTIDVNRVVEDRLEGSTLSTFDGELNVDLNDKLLDQVSPKNSSPTPLYLKTAGKWDKINLRFLLQSGAVFTNGGAVPAFVPIRIEIKRKGDEVWRNMPTLLLQDIHSGAGPVRAEVSLIRERTRGGPLITNGQDKYKIREITNITGYGQWFEYRSDPYFAGPRTWIAGNNGLLFGMTGYSNASATVSSNSENSGSNLAWNAFDATASAWVSAPNSLPAWLKVQFAVPTLLKSYIFAAATLARTPLKWLLEGSQDNINWIALDESAIDVSQNITNNFACGIKNYGTYTYYRWTFLKSNTDPQNIVSVSQMYLYSTQIGGSTLATNEFVTSTGGPALHSADQNISRCLNATITSNGAEFFLDPDQWSGDDTDIRIMRGTAQITSQFSSYAYSNANGVIGTSFFEYTQSGGGAPTTGPYSIINGQRYYRSDTALEVFQTHHYMPPFDPAGICYIAISAPNIVVKSVSAEFTRYAPIWTGTEWSDTEYPTENPAAFYRQLLLGAANIKPVPGELIDEDNLVEAFVFARDNYLRVGVVLSGVSIQEAKQLLASCMMSSPRDSNTYGLVIDKKRTEPIKYLFSPITSRDLGKTLQVLDIPHCIRATFNDEAENYAVKEVFIYRAGFDQNTPNLKIQTINYRGTNSETDVIRLATYHLKQLIRRKARYNREVSRVGYKLKRGDHVGLSDDILNGNQTSGWIQQITRDGGNITAITLDNIIRRSKTQALSNMDDILTLSDVLSPAQTLAVAIEIPGQPVVVRPILEVTDGNTCTFVTPIPDDPEITEDLQVLCGTLGSTFKYMKIMNVIPKGRDVFEIQMADEAADILL